MTPTSLMNFGNASVDSSSTFYLILGTALLTFGLDFAVFRVRAATNRNAYGSVISKPLLCYPSKKRKDATDLRSAAAGDLRQCSFPHAHRFHAGTSPGIRTSEQISRKPKTVAYRTLG